MSGWSLPRSREKSRRRMTPPPPPPPPAEATSTRSSPLVASRSSRRWRRTRRPTPLGESPRRCPCRGVPSTTSCSAPPYLQALHRSRLASGRRLKVIAAVTTLAARARRHVLMNKYRRLRNGAIRLQAMHRGKFARSQPAQKRFKATAAAESMTMSHDQPIASKVATRQHQSDAIPLLLFPPAAAALRKKTNGLIRRNELQEKFMSILQRSRRQIAALPSSRVRLLMAAIVFGAAVLPLLSPVAAPVWTRATDWRSASDAMRPAPPALQCTASPSRGRWQYHPDGRVSPLPSAGTRQVSCGGDELGPPRRFVERSQAAAAKPFSVRAAPEQAIIERTSVDTPGTRQRVSPRWSHRSRGATVSTTAAAAAPPEESGNEHSCCVGRVWRRSHRCQGHLGRIRE